MKKTKSLFFISVCTLSLSIVSCTTNNQKKVDGKDSLSLNNVDSNAVDSTHTSENSLDWAGTYTGVFPCADCPGIETTVVLKEDKTFNYTGKYKDSDVKIEDNGQFMWHDNGSVVHLVGKEVNMKLKVGENQLISLDQEGKPIEGPLSESYILKKQN